MKSILVRIIMPIQLIAAFCFFSFYSYATIQDSSLISIRADNIPLEVVFKQIEAQTGYTFYYAKSILDGNQRITANLSNVSFSKVMSVILDGKNITWKKDNKAIIISRKPDKSLELKVGKDTLPGVTITGMVTDSIGKTLPGVTIQVKDATLGTSTDENGRFTIFNVPRSAVLIFRSVGYKTKQIKTSGSKNLDVVLELSIKEIKPVEVLSTGYQTISRERATGSFVQLNNEIINRKVSTNIFDRITEITSGFNLNPRNLHSGSRNAFQIRGVSTLVANNLPLIVVDGFAYDNAKDSPSQLYDYLNNLNPNDIESITVLKDAAAASIWGARSGNGVIIINTKKGKYQQKTQVQFNTNVMIEEKPRLSTMNVISSIETIEFEKSLFNRGFYRNAENAGTNSNVYTTLIPPVYELLIAKRDGRISPVEADERIAFYEQNDIRKDVNKHFLQNSISQQYALNVSGGNANHNYYASIGYDRNREAQVGNSSNRFTLRLDNTFRAFKKSELNCYMVFSQIDSKNNGIPFESFFGPTRPIYNDLVDADGNALPVALGLRTFFTENPGNADYLDWTYRPWDELRNNRNETRMINTRFGGMFKYNLIKGLDVELRGQYELGSTDQKILNNIKSYTTRNLINLYMFRDVNGTLQYPVPLNGILDNNITKMEAWNIRAQLNFSRRFNDHELNAIAGTEVREVKNDVSFVKRYGYDEATGMYNIRPDYVTLYKINPSGTGSASIPAGDYLRGILNRTRSYYINSSYTFRSKYTLSASARKDGANLFGVKANDRVVPLWSSGLLWDLSREPFYGVEWLPEFKLRVSYGFNGNMRNDATTYATLFHSIDPGFVSQLNSAYIETPPNPSLRWERIRIINVGLDFASKENRINGTLEFYQKRGLDLISNLQVDPTAYINSVGQSFYVGNGASIIGKGLDLTLNTVNIIKRHFYWHTNLLFNYNTEEITSLGDGRKATSTSGTALLSEGAPQVGRPVFAMYSFKWAGLSPINGDPMGYSSKTIVPYNIVLANSGTIPNTKPEDMLFHGQVNPVFWGALRNTISYRRLRFSANILYKFGHFFRRPSINYTTLYGNMNGHSDFTKRWKKPGDELLTNVPSLPLTANGVRDQFYQSSEILVERADHIRFQDVRLDYSLNGNSLSRIPFKNIVIYVYANNIGLVWTANRYGIDPEWERTYTGIPPARTLALGVTANF